MIEANLPYKSDLKLHQGASLTRRLSWLVQDTDEPVIDLDDFNAKLTLKPGLAGFGNAITLTNTNGGITLNASEGMITIYLTAAQTASLTNDPSRRKWGEYDLCLYPKVGTEPVYYIIRGDVLVTNRVTKP